MTIFILLAPFVILIVASAFDLKTREIPDSLSIAIVGVSVVAAWLELANIRWWMLFTGGLLGIAVGALLFRFAQLGGGDAKLIAAIGTFLGPVGLLFALFWMALGGGLLALIAMARGQRDYAYGPAIAFGYLGCLIWPLDIIGQLFNYSEIG